ncbi:MAG: 16S rRNA (guanine(527)-N(7))-methyltransferase RsmG [Firmicutes bacterium]|nr:16S rRNA (guanine(527)-N(7))-methyltransferase RsmG [Bacillota bacterium]
MIEFDEKALISLADENGISISHENAAILCRFAAYLSEENEKYDLTAVKDETGIYVRHFIDSLTALPYIKGNTLIDIGSGAGFPAIPTAVIRPSLSVCALDSTGKRMSFVKSASEMLALTNVRAVTARAEEAAHKPELREAFDTTISRAVAKLSILAELTIPFAAVGGVIIAMKGSEETARAEIREAVGAIETLGAMVEDVVPTRICGAGETMNRTLVIMRKHSHTPAAYPRRYAKILKERI